MASNTRRLCGAAILHVGDRVRIQPHDGNQHFGRGVVVEVRRDHALVKPFPRHGHTEWVPISGLRIWKSANEQSKLMAAGRKHA